MVTQLKAAILEMDEVGRQLPAQEEAEFSRLVEPHLRKALEVIKSFTLASQVTEELSLQDAEALREVNNQQQQLQLQKEQYAEEQLALEQRKAQLESYENLQQDIEDLHDLFSQFAQQVNVRSSSTF